jgi:glycosyltransferase involved in cell wall biosynthesis
LLTDQKIRIVIVLPSLSAGGSERVVSLIANSWASRGWKVAIITFERADTPPYYEIDPRVELVRLDIPNERVGPLRGVWRVLNRVQRLRRQLLRLAPDIVITFLTRTNILSLLAARGTGIPVVVSERNNPELQTFGPVWTWMRKHLYPRAFGLVTMTKGAMSLFPPEQRERSWIIPNEANLPANLQSRRGQRILAAVGRLVPQKGFDLLLEAFARVAAAQPEWTLVIWGEGPERAALESQRSMLGLDGRVELPGVSERPGLWIETADAFVFSSRYEGWGIVLLEAMAAGLPVVSFDCRFGPSEMVTDGEDGLLVPNGDVQALSEAMSRLMGSETLRKSLGEAAAKSARRFSRERVMAEWDEVVKAAVEHGVGDMRPAPARSKGTAKVTTAV